MNPSFVRIELPLETAMRRFSAWIGLPELEPPRRVANLDSVSEACDADSKWRGAALYVYEVDGWSVFDDLSGCLGAVEPRRWLALAQESSLVFAGYNDSIPYGEFVRIEDGRLLRSYLEDKTDLQAHRDDGIDPPLGPWIDVASLVDDDVALAGCPEFGLLWLFAYSA